MSRSLPSDSLELRVVVGSCIIGKTLLRGHGPLGWCRLGLWNRHFQGRRTRFAKLPLVKLRMNQSSLRAFLCSSPKSRDRDLKIFFSFSTAPSPRRKFVSWNETSNFEQSKWACTTRSIQTEPSIPVEHLELIHSPCPSQELQAMSSALWSWKS